MLLKALYSLQAIVLSYSSPLPAPTTTAIPGTFLFFNADQHYVPISACTLDTVDVHQQYAQNLQPGHILVASVAGIDCESSETALTNPEAQQSSSLLLRRITSRIGDTNTFATTFATFREVFPEEIYIRYLQPDTEIEPLLLDDNDGAGVIVEGGRKSHSLRAPRTTHHRRRKLVEVCFGECFELNDELGAILFFLTAPLAVFSCPCWFPFVLPVALISSFWATFPLWPCLFVLGIFIGFLSEETSDLRRPFSRKPKDSSEDTEDSDKETIAPSNVRRILFEEDFQFPQNQDGWLHADAEGKCTYADCSIGKNGDPMNCFDHSIELNSGCGDGTMINVVPDSVVESAFRSSSSNSTSSVASLNEICRTHEYCYMSQLGKKTCDEQFFDFMKNSCPPITPSLALPAAAATMSKASFPVKLDVLGQNCHLLAALLYIDLKVFGHRAFNNAQRKQLEHTRTATCNKPP